MADAARRGLDRIVFWDPVAPERIADLLRLATGGLACTLSGELYRSIRSAKMPPVMASGTPVVYSGDDEGAGLVAEFRAGLATPAGDARALADAVRRIISDPGEAAAMGERGRSYVVEHASWRAVVARWLADLEAVPPG